MGTSWWATSTTRSKARPVTGDTDGEFNFVLSEVALFNRTEWAKTQPLLPAASDDLADPSTWTIPNPNHDAGFIPRYYSFNEGGTIPIFNKTNYYDPAINAWVGDEHGSNWDLTEMTYANPGDPADPLLFNADGSTRAVVRALTAEGGWITDAVLSTMMADATAARVQGEPFKIDGLYYSNNSIFGIVSSSGPMDGQMTVNGAIIASDVGLLVPGNGGVGLRLNFDKRTSDLLTLRSIDEMVFRRVASVGAAILD